LCYFIYLDWNRGIFGFVLSDRPTPFFENLALPVFSSRGITYLVTMMNVIFSYQGSELIGTAESKNLKRTFLMPIETYF
jgi:arginine/ornithine permease